MGIPRVKYQTDWKSWLRWEKRCIVNKFSIRNSGASSGDVRKLGAQRAKRGKLYRDTGLKATVVTIIKVTLNRRGAGRWFGCLGRERSVS